MNVLSIRDRLCAARLSPAGRGAVATIRVCHQANANSADRSDSDHKKKWFDVLNSFFRAANGIPLVEQPICRIVFGQWGTSNVEDLVICRVADTVLEIHCHGGDAAVRRILDDLSTAGCQIVTWQEQLKFQNGFEAECHEALSRASTWRTAKILLEQSQGVLRAAFAELGSIVPDDQFGLSQSVDNLLHWARFGLRLSNPWSVVLTGPPNVGKSSLINLLLGYRRAIVYDEPGTTRDVVTGETAFDGWPVSLSDTAGIRQATGELEAIGIELARERLRAADLQIVVIDISRPPTVDDLRLLNEYADPIVVANKSDLADAWHDELPEGAFRVSSVTGDGVSQLQQRIVDRLVPRVPKRGTPIPISQRQILILREIQSATSTEARQDLIRSLLE